MIRGFSSLITVLLSTSSLSGDKRRTRNRRLSIASLEDRVAPAADLISRKRRYIDAVQRKKHPSSRPRQPSVGSCTGQNVISAI